MTPDSVDPPADAESDTDGDTENIEDVEVEVVVSDSDLPLSESNLTVKDVVDDEVVSSQDHGDLQDHDEDDVASEEEDYVIQVDEILPNTDDTSAPVYGISVMLAPTPNDAANAPYDDQDVEVPDDEKSCIEEELIVPVDDDEAASSHNDVDDGVDEPLEVWLYESLLFFYYTIWMWMSPHFHVLKAVKCFFLYEITPLYSLLMAGILFLSIPQFFLKKLAAPECNYI